jgi:hypothetical protein
LENSLYESRLLNSHHESIYVGLKRLLPTKNESVVAGRLTTGNRKGGTGDRKRGTDAMTPGSKGMLTGT